ncbi:MAG: 50S ribosomal protein L19e [Candidatus Micrarchaeota archaeon]|nr:50S ribosomal protein L19e [Candidatus Micrarchaeota archaeon]
MAIKTVKRLAAMILRRGASAIKIASGQDKKAGEALTREDVRGLISSGAIYVERKRGVSRAKARIRARKRKLGRMRGPGKRKGKRFSRLPQKTQWIARIRVLRRELAALRDSKNIDNKTYRHMYAMAKGAAFRSRGQMLAYLKENNLMLGSKE